MAFVAPNLHLKFQPVLSDHPFLFFHLLHDRIWPHDLTFHSCPSFCLSATRTTRHQNIPTCQDRQGSNLVPIVMRAHGCSDLGKCPTLRVNLTWYSDWNCQDLRSGVNPGAVCPISFGAVPDVLFLSKVLVFQVVRLNFVYVSLCPLSCNPL